MEKRSTRQLLFVFFIVVLFHALNNLIWFKIDSYTVHGCHSVWHEEMSVRLASLLRDPSYSLIDKVALLFDNLKLSHYGYSFSITNFSIINIGLALIYALPLIGEMKLLCVNAFFFGQFCLFLYLLYLIAKAVWNRTVGLWAIVIASFYPGLIGLSRKVNSLVVTTIVLLVFVLIMQNPKKYSGARFVLAAIITALGVLSSPVYFAFAIPLVFLFFIQSFSLRPLGFFKAGIQIVLFLLPLMFLLQWSLGGSYDIFFERLMSNLTEAYEKISFQSDSFIGSAKEGLVESFLYASQDSICPCTQTTNVGFNVKTFLFYGAQLMKYASFPFFSLGIVSFIWMLFSKGTKKSHKVLFCVWFCASYFLLSVYHVKWGKFCTPLLPVLALCSAYIVTEKIFLRRLVQILVIVCGFIVVSYFSYWRYPHLNIFEKLTEGIVAHRPLPSSNKTVAYNASHTIQKYLGERSVPWKLAFLDMDSVRFNGANWVSDMSVRLGLLISANITEYHSINFYWNCDAETLERFSSVDVLCVLSLEPIRDIKKYLYRRRKEDAITFELITQQEVRKNTFLYVYGVKE